MACLYTSGFVVSFFYILSKTDKSEVQIDSKEGYLTLWCHQPHPGQSLNPQTMAEFGDQEVESVWIFQRVLSLVVQKHSCKWGLSGQVFSFKTLFIDSFLRPFFKDISCAFA